MSLENFGWNPFFEKEFAPFRDSGAIPARIASADREGFIVWTESGEAEANISGRLRHSSELWPAVGDWVVIKNNGRIAAVLPRKTVFSRKQAGLVTREQVIAANIDVLFVVAGLDGDFNPRRIERYVLLAWESGATPVIVLNKTDLCPDPNGAIASVAAVSAGAQVIAVSALEDKGLPAIEAHLKAGRTAALVGSSGAGKSTLVNRLLGRECQRVQEVRADDSRGRHTTVRRELFIAPAGWLLIDTPGMREVQLWAAPSSVGLAFDDITALAAHCRFRDCRHQGEPGCAVAASGIDEDRLASYAKLQREATHLERKQNQRSAVEEKRRIKKIHRAMRHSKK